MSVSVTGGVRFRSLSLGRSISRWRAASRSLIMRMQHLDEFAEGSRACLCHYRGAMPFYRAYRNIQKRSNDLVGLAGSQQIEDFGFTPG